MSVLPRKVVDRIQFCEDHIDPFTANAVAIGTSAAAVTALNTKVEAARAAYDAQQAAQQAARAATHDLSMAADAMTLAIASIISQIKTQAGITGPSVYSLAEIPAPATPTPVGTLGKPSDFEVTLDATGALNLKWKCTNPVSASGTVYQVYRRTTASGDFTYIGGSGQKVFVDDTLPAGSSQVTYQLQAVRSTATGPWAQFNVNFGVGGGASTVASVSESAPSPIAA